MEHITQKAKDFVSSTRETTASAVSSMMADKKDRSLESARVDDAKPNHFITTQFGTRINHTDDSLKLGARGPTLLEDFHLREKITHFDHERIPERVVHARGAAAHGYFELDESIAQYTKAKVLTETSRRVPVFTRFSTVLGSKGSADTVRDVRGFAVRFYTDEGNWDLVGNNIPVFFIQDAIKFPDVIHAGKPEPHNELPQAQTAHDNFWDFISLTPEASHMAMWALSDRAIPRSFRMMQGFGVHSFALVNEAGERHFVKFHWTPTLGTHSLAWDEAQKLGGQDPDFHRRDLWEAIENGVYPEWKFGVQIFTEQQAEDWDFDFLDSTKLIPEELVPVKYIGKMVLDRNPDNYFSETEQVAYCVSNVVPGIDFSNDPLLQGRLFSYVDTQINRFSGANYNELPINRPVCPVFNHQRDGYMRHTINTSRVNYHPNRHACPVLASAQEGGYVTYPEMNAAVKERARGPKFRDYFSQATLFYNSLSTAEKEHLIKAAKFEMSKVDDLGVRERMIELLNHIDFELAKEVAPAIGVEEPKAPVTQNKGVKSTPLSQEHTAKDSIKSRKVAILVGHGFDSTQLNEIRAALKAEGAMSFLVGPNKGPIKSENLAQDNQSLTGHTIDANFSWFNSKSTMFDAVFVPGGSHIQALSKSGDVITFVNEAFKHYKPLVATAEGVEFLEKYCQLPGVRLSMVGDSVVSDQGVVTQREYELGSGLSAAKQFIEAMKQHRFWMRQTDSVVA